MNKYQEALERARICGDRDCSECKFNEICINDKKGWYGTLKELVDKTIPKKLKSKTDKDGRLLLVCPTCGDVYIKFWSDVETISCRKYCDECGQKLDWSDRND